MVIETDRLVAAGAPDQGDEAMDRAIRPRRLVDYIGQRVVCEQMEIFLAAARGRGEPLDHTLIFGPPGLGKTTLASIVAAEMGVQLRTTSGPVLEKAGDVAALMTNLEPGDVLFIDEIHRLSPYVEEVLYPAMEDFQLDIMIGEGPAARSIKLDLPRLHWWALPPARDCSLHRSGIGSGLSSDWSFTTLLSSARLLNARQAFSLFLSRTRVQRLSPVVPAVRRALLTGYFGACAITRRLKRTAV